MKEWLRKLIGVNPAKEFIEFGIDLTKGDDSMSQISISYKGSEYRIKEGKPEAGDLALFIKDGYDVTAGKVYEIEDIGYGRDIIFSDDVGCEHHWDNPSEYYIVLETKEGESKCNDMLASLAQEVAKLKREISELQASKANREDVEKFAETATQAELVAKKASEDILALAYDVDALKRTEMERRK